MLVIISDLHLTDGTSGRTIRSGAFRAFRERLRDLAYDASWRADGKYEPIEQCDILLLGDILDVIRSTKWLDGDDARPWSDAADKPFRAKVAAITDAILGNEVNDESFRVLRSLQDPKVLTIPEATTKHRPKKVSHDPDATDRRPVKVNLHYMVGNHDWFYHLPGDAFDAVRQRIADAMGLANLPTKPFPHDPQESATIRELLARHQVFARHGDIYDPFNFEKERNASSLGDAIVVELLNRFPSEVERQLGDVLPEACLAGLKEVDNVRPLLAVPSWLAGLLGRMCPNPETAKQVKHIWNDLADEFLGLDFVRARDRWFRFDLVDKLQFALKFSTGLSLPDLGGLADWWRRFAGKRQGAWQKHAFGEMAFKNRTARYIVYGHTHHHEVVPLDSCLLPDGLFEQMYINSGTWRRVHERTTWRPEEQEFIDFDVMTYLAFFTDGERRGRTFESWSGCLGGEPAVSRLLH